MEPKNLNQLDPKLKETYDRVMGTTVNPAAQSTPPPPAAQNAPEKTETVHAPAPAAPTQVTQTINVSESPAIVSKANVAQKKKKGISPLIIFLGIIVFVAAYTVVWVKFFNLSVPFLNP